MTAKKVYLEWMRVIAIFLVIFNHLPGFALFRSETGLSQFLHMFLSMVVRINIPLFLMISGAVLLGKNEDYLSVLKKRVFRFVLVILIFSLGLYALNALYFLRIKKESFDFSLHRFISGVLSGTLYGADSYWFLYAFLSYLLMLPLFQRMAKGLRKQDFLALVLLRFLVSGLIPFLNLLLPSLGLQTIRFSGFFNVLLADSQVCFYPLIGWCLDTMVDVRRLSRGKTALIAAAGATCLAAACGCTYWQAAQTGAFSEKFVTMMDYAGGMAAFLLIKRWVTTRRPALSGGRIARLVCLAGSLTFGVYLLDPYLKVALWGPFTRLFPAGWPVTAVCLIWCVFSLCLGGAITYALKKIPGVRKLL